MASVIIRDTNVKITDVLKLIGEGLTYGKIIEKLNIKLSDIMLSANVAENLITKVISIEGKPVVESTTEFRVRDGRFQTLKEIQQKHPNAFKKWDEHEDNKLITLFKKGVPIQGLANMLKRSTGSIEARLVKHKLIESDKPLRYPTGNE